jgi:sugar transferase (PEP-CTERM/EpsH1 system associated)
MVSDRRIRIMHVVQSLEVGGLENGVVNLLNRLSGEGFDHVVCCLTHAGKLVERIQAKDVKIVEVGLKTDKFHFPVLTLRRLIRGFAPDILHTRGWSTVDGIFAARVAGVARVIHGEHGREAADPHGLNRKRNMIRKFLSPMVDQFVTVSDDLRSWLTQQVGISAHKVTTIHNGVDTQKFSPEGRSAARRQLALEDAVFAIGTVGRLDPVKDHMSLLRAFAPLTRGALPVRLIIVGDGPMRRAIELEIGALRIGDYVELLGEKQNVSMFLKAFDSFVLTSIAEGISNTILEAMASGLPVVATRVGGNPELIEDGVSGQLVGARDAPAMTTALGRYLLEPSVRVAHGDAGRMRAAQKFSLERMAERYRELYRSIMHGRSSQAA